jgi:hypothetical protein
MNSIGSSTASLMQAVEIRMAREALDAQEVEGQAVLALLDQTAEVMDQMARELDPDLGRLLDVYL